MTSSIQRDVAPAHRTPGSAPRGLPVAVPVRSVELEHPADLAGAASSPPLSAVPTQHRKWSRPTPEEQAELERQEADERRDQARQRRLDHECQRLQGSMEKLNRRIAELRRSFTSSTAIGYALLAFLGFFLIGFPLLFVPPLTARLRFWGEANRTRSQLIAARWLPMWTGSIEQTPGFCSDRRS